MSGQKTPSSIQMLKLNRQTQKDKLAPHKPLMLLVAIGAWQRGEELDWLLVKRRLGELLGRFTNSKKAKAFEPFMRLSRDEKGSIWAVEGNNLFRSNGEVNVTELNKQNPKARFHQDFIARFLEPTGVLKSLVQWLLEDFPESLHQEILEEVGVEIELFVSPRTALTREFRADVMNAYNHQCAVCGFGGRMDSNTAVAVEAAHIRMKSKDGPNAVTNGLALCSLHHKLFDSGAFFIDEEYKIHVSYRFGGNDVDAMLDYDGCKIRLPRDPDCQPDPQFLAWQEKELFKA